MAPLDESTEIAELETSGSIATEKKSISTILIIISTQTEAFPLVAKFQLSEDQDSVIWFSPELSNQIILRQRQEQELKLISKEQTLKQKPVQDMGIEGELYNTHEVIRSLDI